MKLLSVLALALLAGCPDHKPPTTTAGSGIAGSAVGSAGSGATMNAAVTVTVVGDRPGRPPIDRVLVDVQIRNDDAAARWVLIPTKLPTMAGGVDKLEQLTAKLGAAELTIGRLLGNGGRYAVRLGAGARVTLRKLEVAWWNEGNAKEASFEIQLASDATAGDQPLESWFSKDPTINGAADIDMDTAQHTASHRSPDNKEVPLALTGATAIPVKLTTP